MLSYKDNPPMTLPSIFTSVQTHAPEAPASYLSHTGRSHELKFLIPHWAIEPVLDCAKKHLAPDPNAMLIGDGYSIHTLYFDTEEFNVFYKIGPHKNAKYRIRRYNEESIVYLERKSKPEGRVRKHRTPVPLTDIDYLLEETLPEEWAGRWFGRRLRKRYLRPVSQLSYFRVARVGIMEGHQIRFTLDRGVRCATRSEIGAPGPLARGKDVLPNEEGIVEIKFPVALPTAFKNLFDELGIASGSLSKYRLGIHALGLAPTFCSLEQKPEASSD